MNAIWRFYRGDDRKWRWQRLKVDRTVVAESRAGHKHYDACVADAEGMGYVSQPAQPKLIRKSSH